MDVFDLVKEFLARAKGTFPGHAYTLGAKDFAAWLKKQKQSDRFCDCSELTNIYLDNRDNQTKCSDCGKPIWAA